MGEGGRRVELKGKERRRIPEGKDLGVQREKEKSVKDARDGRISAGGRPFRVSCKDVELRYKEQGRRQGAWHDRKGPPRV